MIQTVFLLHGSLKSSRFFCESWDAPKVKCLKGTYCTEGLVAPIPCQTCPPGRGVLDPGTCETGKDGPVKGSTKDRTCETCKPGWYSSVNDTSPCTDCPAGRFGYKAAATSLQTACEPCFGPRCFLPCATYDATEDQCVEYSTRCEVYPDPDAPACEGDTQTEKDDNCGDGARCGPDDTCEAAGMRVCACGVWCVRVWYAACCAGHTVRALTTAMPHDLAWDWKVYCTRMPRTARTAPAARCAW